MKTDTYAGQLRRVIGEYNKNIGRTAIYANTKEKVLFAKTNFHRGNFYRQLNYRDENVQLLIYKGNTIPSMFRRTSWEELKMAIECH
jgi:hypothetical protein